MMLDMMQHKNPITKKKRQVWVYQITIQ